METKENLLHLFWNCNIRVTLSKSCLVNFNMLYKHVHIDADVREKFHTYTEVLHTSNIIIKIEKSSTFYTYPDY